MVDKIYREYPYLYNGDDKDYEAYLETYANAKDAIICVAFDGSKVIGLAAAMPMSETRKIFQQPLLDHKFDLNSLFYLGEFGASTRIPGTRSAQRNVSKNRRFRA